MKKAVLTSVLYASALLLAAPNSRASGGTGWDHNYFWSLYYSGGYASISFPSANQYPGNFQLNWSGVGDVVGGKGWNPGSGHTINYNVGAINGYNFFGVYGWTTSPLVEYYVCELGSVTYGASYVGSLYSDGHNYSVYKHQQVNQPSIVGTSTFWQYLSQWGGSNTGSNHQVTMSNHFNYWSQHIGGVGTMNYQILAAEAYNGQSGMCNASVW